MIRKCVDCGYEFLAESKWQVFCPDCFARELHSRGKRDFGPLCGCLIMLVSAALSVLLVLWLVGVI